MVSFPENLMAQMKAEQENLRRVITDMESGKLNTGERRAGSSHWVDTTAQDLERFKSSLATVERVLGELEARAAKEWAGTLPPDDMANQPRR